MTQLETLIQTLCPNGVKFVKLDSIATISIGEFVHKNKQTPDGQYPVYNGGTSNTGFYTEYNQTANKIIISARGAAGFVNKIEVPYWAGNSCYSIDIIDKNTNWYFVYYYLKSIEKKIVGKQQKGCIPAVSKKQVQELQIPLPPLAVQSEIVRVLDKFTLHKAELAAELAARLRQYEYYRDKLLTFDDTVKRVKLGEVGEFIRGNGLQKKDFVEEGFPCIHYGQIHTYYGTFTTKTKSFVADPLYSKLKKAHTGDLIIATTSEDAEGVCKAVAWLGKEDVAVSGDAYIFRHSQNPKYMAYLFQTEQFLKYKKRAATGTKVIRVSGESMANFEFPLPPLSEQERIVSILDRFDKLCHDIREGLPAEIELRQKQYEHYRDRLLTFRQLGD